ncbi:glycosyltransferase family 2 protein [Acinetobacter sp. HY1485]|uniref:glycosyltransferase family 2 protein n=1 Tax=Acinetobacter sp. HY1485 TaxID=2970918 RepID=UPI0022B99388|nr:glycosyltransferase [Acinetobacter sp. HY1485]
MKKISLIVPVYRVEKYITACLESICEQLPEPSIEIIVVNDGTPDQSMQMVKRFLARQNIAVAQQFICIDQENLGLSGARNTGLEQAQGEYIAFLDSDDILKSNYFKTLLNILAKQSPDLIQFCAERIDDVGQTSVFLKPMPQEGYLTLNEPQRLEIFNRSAWFSWLRIYKKQLFDGIRFPVRKNYEDAYTTPFLFLKAQSIYITNQVLLQYRINLQGITATKSKKNIDDLGGGALCYLQHIKKYPILTPTLVSISQSYIYDSLNVEGFKTAYERCNNLNLKAYHLDEHLILNRGNRLFFKFGIWFLLLDKILRKLGIQK